MPAATPPWLVEVRDRVDTIDARNAQAFQRCDTGIRAIAATFTPGSAEAAESFLGNLHALNTRYSRAIDDLKSTVSANNSLLSLQHVETLDAITTTLEDLALTIENQLASRLAEQDRDKSRLAPEVDPAPAPTGEETPESIVLGGPAPDNGLPAVAASGFPLGLVAGGLLLLWAVTK